MCGSPSAPCSVGRSWEATAQGTTTLPATPPSVAVDREGRVHLLFESAERNVGSYVVEPWGPNPRSFTFATTPFGLSLALHPNSTRPRVFHQPGAEGGELISPDDKGEWSSVPGGLLDLPVDRRRVVNRDGDVYSGYSSSGDESGYVVYRNQQWDRVPSSEEFQAITPGLSQDASTVHFGAWTGFVWGPPNVQNTLHWWVEGGEPEVVFSYPLALADRNMAVGASQPDARNPQGQPHILFEGASGLRGFRQNLFYGRRLGPNEWETFDIAQDETLDLCLSPMDGAISGMTRCSNDRISLQPLAVLTRGSQVRLLWSRMRKSETFRLFCHDPRNPVSCDWQSLGPEVRSGSIHLSWVEQGQIVTVQVDDRHATSGDAVVDAQGRIHMVYYSNPTDSRPSTVYYRRLDAPIQEAPASPAPVMPGIWPILGLGLLAIRRRARS